MTDDYLKEKWKELEAQIKSEIFGVSEIIKVGNTFKSFDSVKKPQKEPEFGGNKGMMGMGDMNYVVDKPKKQPNIEHFGGKIPFQNQYMKEDPFDEARKNDDFVIFIFINLLILLILKLS